ncbi:UDP-glucose 4-epimerase [archaeon]|nr:UDP-glucose 4-epimerase [archaeon]
MKNKKCVCVTGGAGFIGSNLVDKLINKGYKVIIVDNLSSGFEKNINSKAKFYGVDINHEKVLKYIFEIEKPEYVFHLAAQINLRESIKQPVNDAEINILGTLKLLNCCVEHNVKKIIFSSTGGAIYGDNCSIPTSENEIENPKSPYGIAKLTIEKYLKFYRDVHNLDFVSLRYSNVYGPRQNSKGEAGVIAIFIDNILSKNIPAINGLGEQTRDYIFVEDIVDANLLAIDLEGIYNVSVGEETRVNEIYNKIKKIMNININAIHNPEIKGEQMRSCLNSQNLKDTGWNINYSLDEGLKITIDYFKCQKNKNGK